jgi:hypothetical protein
MARSDKWEPKAKDLELLEKLAGFGMTNEKMAAIFNLTKVTLERRIAIREVDLIL